jgi:hypothetical protein
VRQDSSQYRVDVNISLSEHEQKIFKTLMEVVEEHQLKTTLRVAGGWVRDKVSNKLHAYSPKSIAGDL